MKKLLLLVALAACAAAGCGSNSARIQGQLVENGAPFAVQAQAALVFDRIGGDGKPDPAKSYSVVLDKDGSFKLVVSGGEVPPGAYLVTVQVNGPRTKSGIGRYKGKTLRQEVVAGGNTLTLDLAKFGP